MPTRTYVYAPYQPPALRRRRRLRIAAGCGLLAVAVAVPVVAHPDLGGTPRQLDTAASQRTMIAPHVAVYALPAPAKKKGGGKKKDSDDGGDSSSGSSGSDGDSGSGSGTSRGGGATPLPAPPAASAPIQNGASPGVAPQYPAPQAQYPQAQYPAPAVSPGSGPAAQVLEQVQCPPGGSPGLMCFEAATSGGAAAAMPPVASVPSLPVLGSPGLAAPCPASSSPSASSVGGSGAGTGSTPDGSGTGDGGPGAGGPTAAGDGSSGGDSGGGDSGNKKKSKKSDGGDSDSAALLPQASTPGDLLPAGCGLSMSSPSLTGPGATSFGAGAPGAATDGVPGDLSALEAKAGKRIELTGYSFQDNQGGNNAKISCPQIHQQAGGTGTYADPITVASGGSNGGSSADGIKCGDRFYLPSVQRYVIVEDTGNTPNKDMPHLDMYVGDDPGSTCMSKITGTVTAIPKPPPGLPVLAGPIGNRGHCLLPGAGTGSGGAQ